MHDQLLLAADSCDLDLEMKVERCILNINFKVILAIY